MPAGTVATLHVTNGDSVLYLFGKAGITGTHVGWRDALHEGPVPADLPLAELSRARANYLASRGTKRAIRIFHEFEARDAAIVRAADFEEVVLWFEHDLYDQLQILQVLTILDALDLEPGRISFVQSDTYLGAMTADEIAALYPRRKTITDGVFSAARRGWSAFTSPDPAALVTYAHLDAHGLPFMRAAIRRLCEEYPAPNDGLSRSQRQALTAVAQGPVRKPEELFARAQSREEAPFLGDTGFAAILDDLSREPAPLIEQRGDSLTTTVLGRGVMAGNTDWLEERAIDRWIGGVHLTSGHTPRFDPIAGRLSL